MSVIGARAAGEIEHPSTWIVIDEIGNAVGDHSAGIRHQTQWEIHPAGAGGGGRMLCARRRRRANGLRSIERTRMNLAADLARVVKRLRDEAG